MYEIDFCCMAQGGKAGFHWLHEKKISRFLAMSDFFIGSG